MTQTTICISPRRMLGRLAIVCITFLMLSVDPAHAQRVSYPDVTFDYSPYFDIPCAEMTGQSIEPEAVRELQDRLPVFRKAWQDDAPKLLGTTVKVTGIKFQFREAKAALHLCPGFGYSTSLPLLINMRNFIVVLKGDRAGSLTTFTYLLFHETLHRYVSDHNSAMSGRAAPLLAKYSGEKLPVRSHLYHLTIIDEVYRRLGRQKDLDAIIEFEQTSKAASILNRAREIIKKEGSEAFLREFRVNR